MIRRLLTFLFVAVPVLRGADKPADKTLELLREVGALQDQLKAVQKSLEAKLAELGLANADQTRAAAEQAGKATAALGDRLLKGMQDQQDQQGKTLAAVAGLGSQLQAVTSDLGTMREAVNFLTASLSKLSTQVSDLSAAMKSSQMSTPNASGTAPEISATDLFGNAETDRLGGKFELALQEYAEFVTKFGTSAQAPDAVYHIGSIHYSNREWDDAVKAFDVLIQTYPESKRLPEALYYKGDALARSGHGAEADTALKELRKKFPNNPLAKQSLTVKVPAH